MVSVDLCVRPHTPANQIERDEHLSQRREQYIHSKEIKDGQEEESIIL